MITHTFTRYFSKQDIEPLQKLVLELDDDFERRASYLSEDIQADARRRIRQARDAVAALSDRVPQ
jgi:hypothetical protein